jgi:perosamine synthetase
MSKLAILGGPKTVNKPFKLFNTYGQEELDAATEVIQSGVLSKYLGCWEPDFYGGPKVQEFEKKWAKYFKVKHAISVNSWTSGLMTAVGALDIEPGDEIIVPTWTMTASATAILVWNAIPVFADIDPKTFNIDPVSIRKNISSRTKAILAVDIFGQSADMAAIMGIAKENNLKVISDTAQAPGAMYKGRYAGTIADIGGYSLNYHKHIHTGEGGVLITNDDQLAERMKLIRNHAEAVVEDKGVEKINNMIGFNFRMGEIEAAIGIQQLLKLENAVKSRQKAAERLTKGIGHLRGLHTPYIMEDCTHAYYNYPMKVDENLTCVPATKLAEALIAEGVETGSRYINVHLYPIYQQKIAYGSSGFPWAIGNQESTVKYNKGICPVAEGMNNYGYMSMDFCNYVYSNDEVDLYIQAFLKVWDNLDQL